jgi:hypothetical protein
MHPGLGREPRTSAGGPSSPTAFRLFHGLAAGDRRQAEVEYDVPEALGNNPFALETANSRQFSPILSSCCFAVKTSIQILPKAAEVAENNSLLSSKMLAGREELMATKSTKSPK